MSKYDHSDRLSLFRLTEELGAEQGLSEQFDPKRKIDERFAKAALKILEAEDPDSTHTIYTAISAVLNHWIINSDLPIYQDGVRVADPIALLSTPHKPTKEYIVILPNDFQPEFRDIGPDMDYFEDRIFVHKEEFAALCRRKSLPLPMFWFSAKRPRKPPQGAQRDDALARIARRAYQALSSKGEPPTYRRVVEVLQSHDDKGEYKNKIEEIDYDAEIIWWNDDRGREQSTSFDEFKKRMTRIRKTTPTR